MTDHIAKLAEIAADPARVKDVPREAVPGLIVQCAALQSTLAARMQARGLKESSSGSRGTDNDRLLTTEEAAEILKVDRKWLYRRAKKLPFCRRLSRKKLLFSENGLRHWVANRTA